MSDYEFDFGGSAGPFLRWHPRATEAGDIAAGQWSLRSPGGERTHVESMTRAFVFDVPSPQTGWERSGGAPGVAPEREWGNSPAKLPKRPGPDWSKALSVRIGLSSDSAAWWTQGGAGAWGGLSNIMRILKPLYGTHAPKLPVLRMTGALRTDKGRGATQVPTFELVRWITRPAILEDGAVLDGGDAFDAPFIGPSAAASPPAAPWDDGDPFADLLPDQPKHATRPTAEQFAAKGSNDWAS
jgi:hypothetical protein